MGTKSKYKQARPAASAESATTPPVNRPDTVPSVTATDDTPSSAQTVADTQDRPRVPTPGKWTIREYGEVIKIIGAVLAMLTVVVAVITFAVNLNSRIGAIENAPKVDQLKVERAYAASQDTIKQIADLTARIDKSLATVAKASVGHDEMRLRLQELKAELVDILHKQESSQVQAIKAIEQRLGILETQFRK